ncbi:hypothetical protein K4F52_003536 [Lecanicillium sp. MT-2017a]|nr:hypothetical protein K4F52_003536 [Lecanicillium sp. MT-2017a]
MSTPAQKANLARIRDNQRRSRARRREYLQDLEQRLRLCELQGVEATTEVQAAARRVAEENRNLRQLLNKQGFSDSYINQYLQTGVIGPPDAGHGQQFSAGEPGASVRALNQVMVPRRPASIDANVTFPLPSQVLSDSSISSSPSMSGRTAWESLPVEPSYRTDPQPPPQHQPQHHHHHQPQQPQQHMSMQSGNLPPSGSQQYSTALYMESPAQAGAEYMAPQPVPPMGHVQNQPNPHHSMAGQSRSPLVYSTPMQPYHGNPGPGYPGTSSDYC